MSMNKPDVKLELYESNGSYRGGDRINGFVNIISPYILNLSGSILMSNLKIKYLYFL